jgi:hypothetical protein
MRQTIRLRFEINGGKNKAIFREKQVIAFKSFVSRRFGQNPRGFAVARRKSDAEFFLDFLGRKLILAPSF